MNLHFFFYSVETPLKSQFAYRIVSQGINIKKNKNVKED